MSRIPVLKRVMRCLAVLSGCLLLISCSNALRWTPEHHTVRAGETLYSIAMRYNLDHRHLAQWNGLGDGTYIRQGQKLRLKPGKAKAGVAPPRAKAVPVKAWPAPRWNWPTAGQVTESYGASPRTESGIRISGRADQPVYAVAAGEVVYAGDGLPGYGQLLIIKHNATWLSAYGFNARLRVQEGSHVSALQHIADMGKTRAGKTQLHFEIRRNGEPVNPQAYLPRR